MVFLLTALSVPSKTLYMYPAECAVNAVLVNALVKKGLASMRRQTHTTYCHHNMLLSTTR